MTEWPDSVLEYDRLRSYLSDEDVGAYPRSADAAIRDLKKVVNELRNDLADLLPTVDAVGFYEENMNIALKRAEEAESELTKVVASHNVLFDEWEKTSSEAAQFEAEAKSANEQADCEAESAALWAKKAQKLEKALECAIEEWQHGEIPPDDVHDFLTLHPEWR